MSADADPGSGGSAASLYPAADDGTVPADAKASPVASDAGSQTGWREAYGSLANRSFLFLWLGTIAMMGSIQMQMIARGFLAFELTGSAKVVGYVGAAAGVPMLVLSLFGGAVADRVERKRLIQMGQAVSVGTAIFITFMLVTDRVTWTHLLIAAALQGTGWAFLGPARRAIIPRVVGQDNISNALAMDGAALSATTLVAPAIAGVLYSAISPDAVYVLVALLGFLALVFTAMVPEQGVTKRDYKSNVVQDIGAGLRYLAHNKLVRVFILFAVASVMLIMPFRSLVPVVVVEVYGLKSQAFGLLISMMGLGSLVGSLAIASMGRWKRGLLLIGGGFVSGIALLLVAAIPVYFAAAVLMIVVGLGEATRRVINMSLVMEHTDEQYQGRISSVMMMTFGLMPLGLLPAGLAMDAFGPREVVAVLGGLMAVVSVVLLLSQRAVREIQ